MTRASLGGVVTLAAFVGSLIVASPKAAWGDVTKGQCVDANAAGQHLRIEHQLAAAREQFQKCSDAACPAVVRNDCAARLVELDAVQSTIIFDARDSSGQSVTAVSVAVDGRPFTETLDGTALAIDPGEREVTFTASGQAVVHKTFVINEGEKARHERVLVSTAAATPAPVSPPPVAPAPRPQAPRSASETSSGLGTQRSVGLVLGGAGVAGVGVGAVLGWLASSAWSSAKTDCGASTSHCNTAGVSSATSSRSTAETDATISTVGFIAGGVLLAGGAVLFLTGAPSGTSDARPTVSLAVAPTLAPGAAGALVTGAF